MYMQQFSIKINGVPASTCSEFPLELVSKWGKAQWGGGTTEHKLTIAECICSNLAKVRVATTRAVMAELADAQD